LGGAELARDGERRVVSDHGSRVRSLGSEPLEGQLEDGPAHLRAEPLALPLRPEPRSGRDRPRAAEALADQALHADRASAAERDEIEAPVVGPPVHEMALVE